MWPQKIDKSEKKNTCQGFPNSIEGWGWGEAVKGTWGGVILVVQKTAFCEHWTSIKIKINITCVSKEYEIKTKMEQEQCLQLKMLFL